MGRNIFTSQFEFLLFFSSRKRGGSATRTIHTSDFRGTVSNVYRGVQQRHNAYYKLHAATFPMHLPIWLMETFDKEKGIVFDPFLGTGTTLIAAEQTGRTCFGLEIDPLYCNAILHRFEQETGTTVRRLKGCARA
jgi:DNA modification methylase